MACTSGYPTSWQTFPYRNPMVPNIQWLEWVQGLIQWIRGHYRYRPVEKPVIADGDGQALQGALVARHQGQREQSIDSESATHASHTHRT